MTILRTKANWVSALSVLFLLSGGTPLRSQERQSEMLLSWGRYGGFAGFCDEMKVSANGEVHLQSCRSKAEKLGKLSSEDLSRLGEWRKSFGSVAIERKDGAVADAMTVMLTLKGTGGGQPNDAQRQQMLEWAERIYSRINAM